MGTLYIQNKSDSDIMELIALDGIHVMATLSPGQYVEVKSKPGTIITPFIVRQKEAQRQG